MKHHTSNYIIHHNQLPFEKEKSSRDSIMEPACDNNDPSIEKETEIPRKSDRNIKTPEMYGEWSYTCNDNIEQLLLKKP